MPTAFIGTGSPTTLTMNGACTVDGPSIGLFVLVSVVPTSSGNSYTAFPTRTLTYGPSNIAAVSLGAVDAPGTANGWAELFYLQGITYGPGATSKVVFTISSAVKSIGIATMTHTNVSQVTPGSFTTNSHTGTSCSLSLASAVGKYVVGGFACSAAITGASAGTQRLVANNGTSGNAQNASVVDAMGAAVSTMTATTASSANWAAVGCGIDFIVASNADHQALVSGLTNNLQGSNGVQSSENANTAIAARANTITTNSTAIAAIQGALTPPSLVNQSINFASLANSGSLPAAFASQAHMEVSGGTAILVPGQTSGNGVCGPTVTDYQTVSVVFSAVNDPAANSFVHLRARTNSSGIGGADFKIDRARGLAILLLGATTISTFAHTLVPGATYAITCGNVATLDPYQYTVTCDGTVLVSYEDTAGALVTPGSSNRSGAIQVTSLGADTPAAYSSFHIQDNFTPGGAPVVGSVLTLETTASTFPVQLTTKTDAVQATIGSSGLAEVWVDDYSFASAASVISQMSFDVLAGSAPTFGAVATGGAGSSPSWTHTPLSTDNYVIVAIDYTTSVSGVTYGGVSMALLGSQFTVTAGVGIAFYGLTITPGAGAKTVAVTGSLVDATSLSYTGVGAVGTPILATGSGTAVTQSFVNHPSCVVLQAMVFNGTTTGQGFTSPTQTSRFTKNETTGTNMPLLVQEMAGTFGTVTGAATAGLSTTWGSLMIPLMGASCVSAAANITNGYWVGEAQAASTTGGTKATSAQLMSGLTPGLNTFVPKYCVVGSGTGSFQYRRCTVTPK